MEGDDGARLFADEEVVAVTADGLPRTSLKNPSSLTSIGNTLKEKRRVQLKTWNDRQPFRKCTRS